MFLVLRQVFTYVNQTNAAQMSTLLENWTTFLWITKVKFFRCNVEGVKATITFYIHPYSRLLYLIARTRTFKFKATERRKELERIWIARNSQKYNVWPNKKIKKHIWHLHWTVSWERPPPPAASLQFGCVPAALPAIQIRHLNTTKSNTTFNYHHFPTVF